MPFSAVFSTSDDRFSQVTVGHVYRKTVGDYCGGTSSAGMGDGGGMGSHFVRER